MMMCRVLSVCLMLMALPVLAGSHHPQVLLDRVAGSPDEGAQIVEHFCSTCHAANPMIPLGAPKPAVVSDWSARLEQGLDILFKHADEGLRGMPPRGGCFECTDKQLWLAIAALLPIDEQKKILEGKIQ